MKFRIAFFIFSCFCFLSSCRTSRQVFEKTDTTKTLSEKRTVSFRDTVYVSPESSTEIKMPLASFEFKRDSNTFQKRFEPRTVSQQNGKATVKVRIERDTVYVTAHCDSVAIAAQIKQEFLERVEAVEQIIDTQEERTRGIPLGRFLLYIALALAAGYALNDVIKFFKTKY